MKSKLMVTGSCGFVAGSVISQALTSWDVHAIDQKHSNAKDKSYSSYLIDLSDTNRLQSLFSQIKPDVVIHTAALANIDFCQNNREMAEKINVGVTQSLATLCETFATKLLFCSTDSIFDGKKGYYTEEDKPGPVNFYAKTKVSAEKIIRETCKNAVITRLGLVMGMPVMGSGNSFLAKTFASLKAGQKVQFPQNEIRTPIDVITLGRALLELAKNNFTGTIHLAGNDRLDRYDMACRIAEKLGYSTNLVVPTNSNSMHGRAPRPNDASLDNSKAKDILTTPMVGLMEGLELTLNYKAN